MARPRAKPKTEKPKSDLSKDGTRRGKNTPTAAQKVERDTKVVMLRSRGRSWTEIAKEVKLDERTCRGIWSTWTKENRHTIQNLDPIDVAVEMIARLDADISLLATIADDVKQQGSTRVGAVRAKDSAIAQQTELLQALDLLPKNLGKLQVELEIRYVVQALLVWANEVIERTVGMARAGDTIDMDEMMGEEEERLLKIFRRHQPALPSGSNN